MNIREYISSGIVETYVLGLAGPEESAEFESLCTSNPEVRAARDAFEKQLEEQIGLQQVAPPREIKSRIFSQIGMEQFPGEPVAPPKKPAMVYRPGFRRFLMAASVILLLGSILLNFYLFGLYKHSFTQYNELLASQQELTRANQSMNTQLERYQSALDLLRDPRVAVVKMPAVATSPAPSSQATVYWNTGSGAVYLMVNQLPKPTTGKQYQLWAIVDGKPVDAGVFDVPDTARLVELKTIPRAQAFAITLEKQGGSETPTMNAMYVMGKTAG